MGKKEILYDKAYDFASEKVENLLDHLDLEVLVSEIYEHIFKVTEKGNEILNDYYIGEIDEVNMMNSSYMEFYIDLSIKDEYEDDYDIIFTSELNFTPIKVTFKLAEDEDIHEDIGEGIDKKYSIDDYWIEIEDIPKNFVDLVEYY